ncbi:MAG TPA: TraR/DksA C4-type zinc finger protein [Thermoleophilaceae bacterium]
MLTGSDRDRVEALLRERADGMVRGRRERRSQDADEHAVEGGEHARIEAHRARRTRVCVACGTTIAPARLELVPEAVRCVPCQQAHEAAP